MKKTIIAAAALALIAAGAQGKSFKRGVSENQFSIGAQLRALEPGMSWYYTWGNTAPKGYQNQIIDFEGMDFVPMCWNGNYSADNIREYVKSHPQCKYLLGFNEPNFKAQANMTPADAAEKWKAVKALADELGLQLVAPALNYSPDAPYQDPTQWMDEFVALVGEDAFDFTAVHNYGGFGGLKALATTFHERYGKPVWVTEFCYWPGEQNGVTVTPAAQIASMVESVEWLEQTPFIYRYAWFKPIGASSQASNSPNYGLLLQQQGLEESFLSEQGKVYVHLPDFDTGRYHATETRFEATDYASRSYAAIGAGNNADCPVPIEISQFTSGATVDWQFNVPAEGNYTLTLQVSGEGDPVRFDPKLAVYSVGDDGTQGSCLTEAETYKLSGKNDTYTTLSFPMTLTAGRQRIRLRDEDPYRPSGIRISTVSLTNSAGIGGISADGASAVDVYSIDGTCVRRAVDRDNAAVGLPRGLYIIGGKKVIVK